MPNSSREFGELWLRDQFHTVLEKVNTQLLALGAAAGDPRIRPVHKLELPPVILGWQNDLRDTDDPNRRPRLFLLSLHHGETPVSELDGVTINRAIAISEHVGHGPFSSSMEFLFAARRSLDAGRPGHAVVEAGTAVELLVNGVVRAVGLKKQISEQKLENLLEQTSFRNLYVDHFARALGVTVPNTGSTDPINAWLDGGYQFRNRVAHTGYRPSDLEAASAVVQAHALLEYVGDRATQDMGLGISFPETRSLIPHPELDERSIASELNPSEDRLAEEAFGRAIAASNRGEANQFVEEQLIEASRHGSPRGAFNLAIARWRAGDLDGARSSLQLAAERGHAGGAAYMGLLNMVDGDETRAEELFRSVTPGAHSRGWPLAAFFLATILANRDEKVEATELYRDAAVVSSTVLGAEAAYRRGLLLDELGDPAAIDSWTFAVELGSARAAVRLAHRFVSEGDAGRAVALLERAQNLDADLIENGVDIGYGLYLSIEAPIRTVQAEIAQAMIMVAGALQASGEAEEAVALCDDLIDRYANAPEPMLQDAAARALLSKGAYLGGLGRHIEALAASMAAIEKFGAATDIVLVERVTSAQLNRAYALVQLVSPVVNSFEKSP